MTESIGEMIIPGTYIEVRAEGLIGVGGIPTGNIGMVGTANRGPVNEVVILGSYAEALATFGNYDAWPDDPAANPPLTLTRALEQTFRGGASTVYAVRVAAGTAMRSMTWTVTGTVGTNTNATLFTLVARSPGTWANAIVAQVTQAAAAGEDATLTLTLGATRETFRAPTAAALAREVDDASNFVTTGPPPATVTNPTPPPATIPNPALAAAPGAAPTSVPAAAAANQGGPDGAIVTPSDIADGLALLATRPINIVNVAGLGADVVSAVVLGHLEATETEGHERIALMGTRGDTLAETALGNGRAILVAPGIVANDAAANGREVRLSPAYAASLVTGRLAALAPHVSLTNKDVAAAGLTREYTRAEQKQLLLNRILALHRNLGFRVLRGISTDDGPFKQITARRIVDFAKFGVRIGANPYIGRLNNSRVRLALKATLDAFLSQMVLDEMIISYELEVSATRGQEIAGIAAVTMVLRPTFSIDFIRVTMILE
jgi:hypothetical protein